MRLHLLGPVYLSEGASGETRTFTLTQQKAAGLLGYLATHRHSVTRNYLAGLLWDELDSPAQKRNLRALLHELSTYTYPGLLEADRQAVHLVAETDMSEVARLEARGDLASLSAAANLIRGEFLAGVSAETSPDFEAWLTDTRLAWQGRTADLLRTLSEQLADAGRTEEAERAAVRLLGLEPWDERAHRQLMQLCWQTGRRAAALRQFEACRAALQGELGLEPDPETRALYRRILAGDAPGPSAQARPELTPRPVAFPAPLTSFVGRERELGEIRTHLQRERLVTLLGIGGVGKTRLALEVAEQSLADYTDGVFFVPLAVTSPGQLASVLARHLGLALPAQGQLEALLSALRGKHLLLVLDNFEHLLADGATLNALLQAAPEVRALVTSRERLGLPGEQCVELAGLDVPPEQDAPDLALFSAPALFAARARLQEPSFTLDEQNVPAVLQLCRLVGGLPLALELAAAWLRLLTPKEIADEVAANLDLLATPEHSERTVDARHRSLRATFDHSWARLDEAERVLYCRLAVFQGGFGRRAVAQMAGATLPHLQSLVDKSLLQVLRGRFALHPLLHAYAQEKLRAEPELVRQAGDAHARYYLGLLREHEVSVSGGAQREALAVLTLELDNIRVAWRWAIYEGLQNQAYLDDLAGALKTLWWVLYIRDTSGEGVALFAESVAALKGSTDREVQRLDGRLHHRLALLQDRAGQFEAAQVSAARGLALLREVGAAQEVASSLTTAGIVASSLGRPDEALRYHEESCEISRARGDERRMASTQLNLALAAAHVGDDAAARTYYEACLAGARALEDRGLLSRALYNYGLFLHRSGEFMAADEAFRESHALSVAFDYKLLIAYSLYGSGLTALARDQFEEANAHLKEARSVAEASGDLRPLVDIQRALAEVALAEGAHEAAQGYLRHALELAQRIGAKPGAMRTLLVAAKLTLVTDTAQAVQFASFVLHHAGRRPYQQAAQALITEAGRSEEEVRAALELVQHTSLNDGLTRAAAQLDPHADAPPSPPDAPLPLLNDAQWTELAPLLPPQPKRGRKRTQDRAVLNSLLCRLSGRPLEALPQTGNYAPARTVYHWSARWKEAGVLAGLEAKLRAFLEESLNEEAQKAQETERGA